MATNENGVEIDETALAVKIFTDFKSALPQQIAWNYDDLKAALENAIAPYRGLVLEKTSENVKFAKSNRAKINKLASAIMEARVETKKRFLQPYQDFEEKCNALINECRTTSGELDDFVKGVEAEIKARKVKFAHDYLTERLEEEFADDIESRDSVFWENFEASHTKWQNLTYSENEIKSDIDSQIENAKTALNTVRTIYGSLSAELLEKSLIEVRRCFDINSAVKVVNEYQKEQERIKAAAEERNRREEAAKLALAEKRKAKAAEEAANAAAVAVPVGQTGNVQTETAKPAEAVSERPTGSADGTKKVDTYTLKFNGSFESVAKVFSAIQSLGIGCDSAEVRMTAPREVFRLFRKEIDCIECLQYSNAAKK